MKMKKLIVFAAAVAMAFVSQAAQLDWSLMSKTVKTQSGANGAGIDVYLMQFASAAAADTFYSNLKDGTVAFSDATAGYIEKTTTATGKSWGAVTQHAASSSSLVADKTAYYALLFTEKVGSDNYFMLSGTAEGKAYATDPDEGLSVSFDASHFGAADSRKGWTAAAPEPTSGLLMLIGLGALALRRRRA